MKLDLSLVKEEERESVHIERTQVNLNEENTMLMISITIYIRLPLNKLINWNFLIADSKILYTLHLKYKNDSEIADHIDSDLPMSQLPLPQQSLKQLKSF